MIRVLVNDEQRQCPAETSVAALLEALGYRCEGVAVAIDGEFLPRSEHAQRRLRGGEHLDVVAPVQGG